MLARYSLLGQNYSLPCCLSLSGRQREVDSRLKVEKESRDEPHATEDYCRTTRATQQKCGSVRDHVSQVETPEYRMPRIMAS